MNIKKILNNRANGKASVNRYTRTKFGNFAIFTFLTLAGLFSVLPLIYCICTSFKPLDELLIFPPRFFVKRPTIANYIILPDLMSSLEVPFSRYFLNSLFTSITSTLCYIVVASMAAYVLSKGKFKGKTTIFWIVQFALMFNATTLSIPSYFIYSRLNMLDSYWIYILPQFASTLGVFLTKQYIEGYIPDVLLEAAKIDGANQLKIYWSIVMPIIKPAWLTLVLFSFRDLWSSSPGGMIFTEQLKTLPQIVSQITSGGTARAGSAMAVSVMMMIPPIIVFLISQSNVTEAMSSVGIKE